MIGFVANLERGTDSGDFVVAGDDDEGSLAIVRDLEEGLTAQQTHYPPVFAKFDPDLGIGIERDAAAILQGYGTLFTDGGDVLGVLLQTVAQESSRSYKQ